MMVQAHLTICILIGDGMVIAMGSSTPMSSVLIWGIAMTMRPEITAMIMILVILYILQSNNKLIY